MTISELKTDCKATYKAVPSSTDNGVRMVRLTLGCKCDDCIAFGLIHRTLKTPIRTNQFSTFLPDDKSTNKLIDRIKRNLFAAEGSNFGKMGNQLYAISRFPNKDGLVHYAFVPRIERDGPVISLDDMIEELKTLGMYEELTALGFEKFYHFEIATPQNSIEEKCGALINEQGKIKSVADIVYFNKNNGAAASSIGPHKSTDYHDYNFADRKTRYERDGVDPDSIVTTQHEVISLPRYMLKELAKEITENQNPIILEALLKHMNGRQMILQYNKASAIAVRNLLYTMTAEQIANLIYEKARLEKYQEQQESVDIQYTNYSLVETIHETIDNFYGFGRKIGLDISIVTRDGVIAELMTKFDMPEYAAELTYLFMNGEEWLFIPDKIPGPVKKLIKFSKYRGPGRSPNPNPV